MKTITLYRNADASTDSIITADEMHELYETACESNTADYGAPLYKSFNEWLNAMISAGWYEEIGGTVASASKVYPFYFNSVTHETLTALQVYANYLEQRDYMADSSFAYFLNASRDDENADTLYGFEM